MARKKALSLPLSVRRSWVRASAKYSLRRQCRLAGISRSGLYYEPAQETDENLLLMSLIDRQYMKHPEYGYPRMTDWLRDEGYVVNPKRIARLYSAQVRPSGADPNTFSSLCVSIPTYTCFMACPFGLNCVFNVG